MKHNFFRLIFIFLGIISSFNGLVMFFITAIELKTIFLKLAVVGIVFGMLFWAESLHLFKTAKTIKHAESAFTLYLDFSFFLLLLGWLNLIMSGLAVNLGIIYKILSVIGYSSIVLFLICISIAQIYSFISVFKNKKF